MNIKKSFGFIFIFAALACVAAAQETRQPSTPIRPYIVKTNQEVADLERSLGDENKVAELIGGAGMQLRVAIQHDEKRDSSEAELHDASDDVYYVLSGSAGLTLGGRLAELISVKELTLGGALENPREATPGEWKGKAIIGGQTFRIKKGDLIIVPRGTPHQRVNTKGKEFSLILIKIYRDPLPAK